jgi:hypothetical protein
MTPGDLLCLFFILRVASDMPHTPHRVYVKTMARLDSRLSLLTPSRRL